MRSDIPPQRFKMVTVDKATRKITNTPSKQAAALALASVTGLCFLYSQIGSALTRAKTSHRKTWTGYGGIESWYRHLVDEKLKSCNHTYSFFNYFLPHERCLNPKRYGKCKDGSKYICLDAFQGRNSKRADKKKQRCTVYSFGSSDDSCFEAAMAENFDCDIHIFDPTSAELHDERWTYHSYGLGGADSKVTDYWDRYTQRPSNCTGCAMKNLPEIMKELKHDHIDILKVDIDGAEWRSFEYIYQHWKTLPADQLQIELTGLDVTMLSESLAGGFHGAFGFWNSVQKDGFKVFQLEPNQGTCRYRPKERAVSFEYAMWRGNS